MKKIVYLLVMVTLLSGCAYMIRPTPTQIATADYGQYPDDYKEIVNRWINNTFFDPYSVRDLTISTPEKSYIQDPPLLGGATSYGYLITVTCNAKNRMGGYTGKKTSYLLIYNGMIMKQWGEGGDTNS